MVSIVDRRPMTLGIIPILDAYIKHKKELLLKDVNLIWQQQSVRCILF